MGYLGGYLGFGSDGTTDGLNYLGGYLGLGSTGGTPVTSDNYKAKLMRHMLPPPYNQDFDSVIGIILTTIGQSDNLIGGLFGTDDFLPDED
jgi:hypothetical protein